MHTFKYTDKPRHERGPPSYPILSRDRFPRPVRVDRVTLVGHQSSFFRGGEYGELPALDAMHATFVRALNPVEIQLVGLDRDWHCRTDLCSTFERKPDQRGWDRLATVAFRGASLYPPLRSTSFGKRRRNCPPWKVVFEVQGKAHSPIIKSPSHRIVWLSNLCWHIFQRDRPGFGKYPTFPNSTMTRIKVLVCTEEDRKAASCVLSREATLALGEEKGHERMTYIDIAVGRLH